MDAAVDLQRVRNNYDAQGERPRRPRRLLARLRHHRRYVWVVAIAARDVDAPQLGFATTVLWNLTRPVTSESDEGVRAALERAGVAIRDAA
jgi:hypothetical protein